MRILQLPDEVLARLNVLGLEPLRENRFALEIDGMPEGSRFLAGFSAVDGLESRIEVREVREGGYRGVHRFPRRTLDGPIIVRRLLTSSRFLWDWYREGANWSPGQPSYLRTVALWTLQGVHPPGDLLGEAAVEVWRWELHGAWLSHWIGPPFDGLSDRMAIEGVEIQCQQIAKAESPLDGLTGEAIGLLSQR